jgi:AcrR family transcriptional regulator
MAVVAETRSHAATSGPRAVGTSDAVLDSARRVFAQRGYHGTSIDAVAKNAGVSRASVYTYFRSKRDLLIVLGAESNQLMQTLVEEFPSLGPDFADDAVTAWIGRFFAFLEADQSFAQVWNEAAVSDEALRTEGLRQWNHAWKTIGVSLCPELQRNEEAAAVGMVVSSALERTWFYLRTLRAPIDERAVSRNLCRLIQSLRSPAARARS